MAIIYGISEATKEFLKKLPKEVQSLEDIDKVHRKMKEEFDSIEDRGLGNKFSRWRKKRQINKIEDNLDGVEHAGAKGEMLALEKLSELPDDYHIFCGVNKDLGKYITYRRRRDLKSAQMDFVVVSKRGVVVIEVKNLNDINSYIQNKQEQFSEKEVKRLIDRVEGDVTK